MSDLQARSAEQAADKPVSSPRAASPAPFAVLADEVLARCDVLARYSEEPGRITRPFPSEAMRGAHACLRGWMEAAGLTVRLDAVGNMIGHYAEKGTGTFSGAVPIAVPQKVPVPFSSAHLVFLIGSHLDSVPNAGRYDGVLGVLLGVATIQALGGERFPFAVDIIAFCEEEGIRFRTPYLGSMALAGRFDREFLQLRDISGVSLAEALRSFGLDPGRVNEAAYPADRVLGYLEAHIEQGPVLDSLDLPLGVVEGIVGQSRSWLHFTGKAGHAGTLPMDMRRDALAAAAEFALAVEAQARSTKNLVATVGTLVIEPGAINVVPGSARLSVDVRHPQDAIREQATAALFEQAAAIARRRGVEFSLDRSESYPVVAADSRLTGLLATAATSAGYSFLRMVSGAGHDAAVMAGLTPMTMLFLRSPGGVSHHPDEAVLAADVAAALEVMVGFLKQLASGDKR